MRTNIPLRERVAGTIILAILGVVGIAVLWKGASYDPRKFTLRVEALSTTTEDVKGKAATIRVGAVEQSDSLAKMAYKEGFETEKENATPSTSPVGDALTVDVEGILPLSHTEFYDRDTLFEKINGRAPAYFEFDFQNLRARSFGVRGRESFIDILEFEMSSPVTAYGIFSAEREENAETLNFADDGYRSEMGYFLRQGPRYVQILASDQNPETLRIAEAVARDRARALPSSNAGLETMQQLPKQAMIQGTIEYVPSNAFGQAALHNVYQAHYGFEGAEVVFFLMLGAPDEVESAWETYRNFARKYGNVSDSLEVNGSRMFVAETFGNWIAVYFRDHQIGGVVEASSEEAARGFATAFLTGERR